MTKATRISLDEAFEKLEFVRDRTPESTPEDLEGAFATLSPYRDGAVFIGHYAGNSEWERHPQGDEIVMVVEGETTLFVLSDGKESSNVLRKGEMFVVPTNTWAPVTQSSQSSSRVANGSKPLPTTVSVASWVHSSRPGFTDSITGGGSTVEV